MAETVHFSTLLRPHRSLSANGFKWLIRVVILANLLVGLPMYWLGAWPVAGFCGLDVALLWWLFDRLSLIHISEPTRLALISYAVFCLKKIFF